MEKELLYRFFGGEATVEEEKQVLDWIDADPAHRVQLIDERRVFDAMLMHARPAAGRKTFVLLRWMRETMKYAAVVAVALVAGGTYVSRQNAKLLSAANMITVPAGQHVDVTLPDGTRVCMNALSELKYPTFFAGDTRRVQLRGEAFFEVTHDAKHPFVVETYACDVEVLGTKFDVEARAEKGVFCASLVEGKVRVSDRNNPASRVELQPNQQVRRQGERLVVSQLAGQEKFLWRQGLISFRDASFTELLHEFEKYYGVKIEPQRKDVSRKLFTGKIRIAEGIDHALWVLQRSADFSYTRNDTRDVIYIQ